LTIARVAASSQSQEPRCEGCASPRRQQTPLTLEEGTALANLLYVMRYPGEEFT
jgi:hypothetical protein